VDPAPGPLSPDPAPVTPFRRLRLGFLIAAAVLAASGAIVGTLAASFPTGHLLWALGSAGLFELTVVAWLVAGALGLAARRFDWALLVPPIVVAAALVLAWLDLPLQTRFAAARPGFEQVIAARGEAGPGALCPERIGTYRIVLCQTRTRSPGSTPTVAFSTRSVSRTPPTGCRHRPEATARSATRH
jgi:hypothetical protein